MPGRSWGNTGSPEEGGDRKPALVFHSRLTPGIQTHSSIGKGNSIVENGAEDNREPQGFVSIPREETAMVAGGRVACKVLISRPSPILATVSGTTHLPSLGLQFPAFNMEMDDTLLSQVGCGESASPVDGSTHPITKP